jgi:hypothetical protein
MEVDQLASDRTNNDYSKPIYETITYETEAYEIHWFNGDVDLTVATANYNASHGTNFTCEDRYKNMDFNIYLNDLGAIYASTYTKQVCVGTKTVSEQQCVGYEKLPTTTETYVDHYECSCGAIKDQVSHGE